MMHIKSVAFLAAVLTGCFCTMPIVVLADSVQTEDGSAISSHKLEAGIGLRFMPIGWFEFYDAARRTSFRAYPALGFAPFVDYRACRYFSVGVSPELTLNVIPNRSDYIVGKMLVGDARFQFRYPTQTRFEPYAMLTGGYSIIWREEGASSATGPVLGGAVGASVHVSKRHALFVEIDYQKGFQTIDGHDYGPSYLIIATGWHAGFLDE
jgi:hypothetical protein